MHELSICRNILEMVTGWPVEKPYRRIKKIAVTMGQLAVIDPSALRFSFAVIAQGTVAEEAVLEIIFIPGQAVCGSCQETVAIKQYGEACSFCGSFSLQITQGETLQVQSMEVE